MREVKPEQLGWISWLRFFAICGVITIHAVGFTVIAEGARDSRAGILAIILDLGAVFTVPLFVMLSGAVLLDPQRYTDPGNFYRKRLNRLVPAIVFWHLFYWAFRIYVQDRETSPREALRLSLNGDLVTALYFFWIVLGLAVVSPALISWIAASTRRQIIVGGLLAASMPVLSTATLGLRGGPLWVETPWTWWIFYLGLFILGWGLRGVALHGPWLVGATGATMALAILMPWQWNNPRRPRLAPTARSRLVLRHHSPTLRCSDLPRGAIAHPQQGSAARSRSTPPRATRPHARRCNTRRLRPALRHHFARRRDLPRHRRRACGILIGAAGGTSRHRHRGDLRDRSGSATSPRRTPRAVGQPP